MFEQIKVNYNPPKGWVKKLKPGECFCYIDDGLIYRVAKVLPTSIEIAKNHFDVCVCVNSSCFDGFCVDGDGSKLIFPLIVNSMPADAGDGEE